MKIPQYIGETTDGKKLELHKDAVTQGFALMGKRRRGKSNLMGCMMETLAARGQSFVCIDPADAHWGIRYAIGEDGKPSGPSGLDVLVVGGDHADVPLDPAAGRELAHTIVDGDISCVICLKALNYTKLQSFCADFGEELFMLNRTPRHIFFDECQNLLPQQLKFEEQKRVLYAMSKIVAEGGGNGLGFTLASQRPSKVNKDVLEEVDNFIVLGMIGPLDLKQIKDWFEHHVGDKDKLQSIIADVAQLAVGDCWFLSPDWMNEITKFHARLRVTYHAGRTPKPGERPVNVAKFSVPEAVEHLKKLFAGKQAERQQEIADLSDAKKRIRELTNELAKARRAAPVQKVQPARADPRAIERAVNEQRKNDEAHIESLLKSRDVTIAELHKTCGQIAEIARLAAKLKPFGPSAPKLPAVRNGPAVRRQLRPPRPDVLHAHSNGDGDLTPYQRDILRGLAELEAIGRAEVPRGLAGAAAGKSHKSSTFERYTAALRSAGLIEYRGNKLTITDAGRAHVSDVDQSLSPADVQDRLLRILTPYQRDIVKTLVDVEGQALSWDEIGEKIGKSAVSSTFERYMAALRSAEIIEYEGPKRAKAAPWLFLE